MTDHVVILRRSVSDSDLRRLAMYHGRSGHATLGEYRGWAHGTLDSGFADMPTDPAEPDTGREQQETHQA